MQEPVTPTLAQASDRLLVAQTYKKRRPRFSQAQFRMSRRPLNVAFVRIRTV